MVVDNYGNIIEEPFHQYTWCIEWNYWGEDVWSHYKSYKRPIDVQKALKDLDMWRDRFDMKFRPARRIYRKITGGFTAERLVDATDNIWWRQTNRPLKTLKAHEEGRIHKLCDLD